MHAQQYYSAMHSKRGLKFDPLNMCRPVSEEICVILCKAAQKKFNRINGQRGSHCRMKSARPLSVENEYVEKLCLPPEGCSDGTCLGSQGASLYSRSVLRASTPEASGTHTSKSETRIDSSLSTCKNPRTVEGSGQRATLSSNKHMRC